MDKKLICVLFLMVLAVAKMDAGNPPQNAGMRRVGKRNSRFQLIKVKRELCARARAACDAVNDDRDILADFETEEM
ncbi:unnamed protein product [Pocillopora meandrina]|uniref:Uncharacterized protein n=1 Tax=Pocillopora meandrina TaxID=46732 RepID=A0AAU9X997_9CNID|nr:unnamed protein product [Pocillopora meandrina]